MTTSAKKQALGNLRTLIAGKIAVILITVGMIYYMLGNPKMYPAWTLIMIGGIGVVTALSLARDLRA